FLSYHTNRPGRSATALFLLPQLGLIILCSRKRATYNLHKPFNFYKFSTLFSCPFQQKWQRSGIPPLFCHSLSLNGYLFVARFCNSILQYLVRYILTQGNGGGLGGQIHSGGHTVDGIERLLHMGLAVSAHHSVDGHSLSHGTRSFLCFD